MPTKKDRRCILVKDKHAHVQGHSPAKLYEPRMEGVEMVRHDVGTQQMGRNHVGALGHRLLSGLWKLFQIGDHTDTPSEKRVPSLVVLTGAGISAESGIPTYRDKGGLWRGHDPMQLATPQGFAQNPVQVAEFYDHRRADVSSAAPNAAHQALAQLDAKWPGEFLLVTTNVDDLHERAGSERLLHIHGMLRDVQCAKCEHTWNMPEGSLLTCTCSQCGQHGPHRPAVVFFGEMPQNLSQVMESIQRCDVFLAVGCGGAVQPSSRFPKMAAHNKREGYREGRALCRVTEINTVPTADPAFDDVLKGTATQMVPIWVDAALAEAGAPTRLKSEKNRPV
jgi:NAD-dependent deacetylase